MIIWTPNLGFTSALSSDRKDTTKTVKLVLQAWSLSGSTNCVRRSSKKT